MSMYGDTNWVKNDLYDNIKSFLEAYPISELLQVVTDAVESKQDEKITIPSYPNYPVVPTYPDPYVIWAYGGPPVTNTEIKCETPVRDRMVGKVSKEW